jgi:anti-sigma28 factor (negative regulator of flagellin synthesis)
MKVTTLAPERCQPASRSKNKPQGGNSRGQTRPTARISGEVVYLNVAVSGLTDEAHGIMGLSADPARIQHLREAIETNQYTIEPHALAEAIIDEDLC